jgi:hypothetical protein
MNDDEFETKLRALTGALRRPDPTPAWKADILARARREAEAIPLPHTLPPRWLMLSWAAAWVAILALNFTTPTDATSRTEGTLAGGRTNPKSVIGENANASPQALLAWERRMNLNLDQP